MSELEKPMKPEAYKSDQGKPYIPPEEKVWCVIRVLEFLNGRPWNQLALNFVHSLRPVMIRVVRGATTLDAITWRVTVHVDLQGEIDFIEQEVEAGGVGANNGADLRAQLDGRRFPSGSLGILYRPL